MGRRKEVTVDQLVECNGRVSPRDCDLTSGGPRAVGAVDFDGVMVDGVRVAIARAARARSSSRRGGNRRFFVCPRCGRHCWYIYLPGVACMPCLGLRYASRHHLVDQETWHGATQRKPGGERRRRKITHFTHFKRRSFSQAGWRRSRI